MVIWLDDDWLLPSPRIDVEGEAYDESLLDDRVVACSLRFRESSARAEAGVVTR